MKRSLLALTMLLGSVAVAQAGAHNMAGCGLGMLIFKQNSKGEQILASTTNGLFGNQTFGISSETLGCTRDGVVKSDKRREVYASVNLQKLSQEMAQGRGEYLSAFAVLNGCSQPEAQKAFADFAQKSYGKLFPTADTGAADLLKNVDTAVASEPSLAKACNS